MGEGGHFVLGDELKQQLIQEYKTQQTKNNVQNSTQRTPTSATLMCVC